MRQVIAVLAMLLTLAASAQPGEVDDIKRLRVTAEKGDAKAQYDLGLMYEDGKNVPKDRAEAVKWFREAAEQGNAEAVRSLQKAEEQWRAMARDALRAVGKGD